MEPLYELSRRRRLASGESPTGAIDADRSGIIFARYA
jgi:hypothetical protein